MARKVGEDIYERFKKRREQILEVASRLFDEKGYHETTMDDVASQLNVTKAALYRNVRGKEEILWEICIQGMDRMEKWSTRILKSKVSTRDKLRMLIHQQVNASAEFMPMLAVVFGEETALPPKLRERLRRRKKKYEQSIKEIIKKGIDDGTFVPSDPGIVAFAVLGMCNWVYRWYKPTGKLTPDQIGDAFVELIENAYLRNPD